MNMFNMSLSYEMKRFGGLQQVFQKAASHKIMKFADFKNVGSDIQWGTLHAMYEKKIVKVFTAHSR